MDILNYKEDDLVLDEGVNDPGIFKAIILAGGPGSGKTVVARALGLASMGLRVVNSDMYFMHLMKRKGLSLKMPANEFEAREAARYASKAVTDKRLESLVNARLGVIVDSTSGDQKKTTRIIKMLKKSGYDIKVIFIETTLELAKASEHPRAFEVVGQLTKTLVDANNNLLDIQKKVKELSRESSPQNVTNALFVGSTSDLQKLLKEKNE